MQQVLNNFFASRKKQIFFLAVVITSLYFRSLSYQFIGLDEQSLLLEKKNFNKELSNIPKAFSQHVFQTEKYTESPGTTRFYRPLLTVSFILDAQFSGEKFSFFHFSNILIHFTAVIGLLLVLLQLTNSPPLAFLFSLLFAVHPLLTQAIGWIPGRNDSLVSLFVLWSFYFLLKTSSPASSQLLSAKTLNEREKERTRKIFLHIFFFALALFTKENALMFSFICAYYILLMKRKDFSQKNKVILIASYTGVSILWYLMRLHAVGGASIFKNVSLSGGANPATALYHSFLKNFPLLLQYFQKTILPVNLAVMASVKDTNYGWVLAALLLFGAGIYFTKKIPWTEIIFGLLWFFLFLLPTLLFSFFEGMEHRSYLSAIGILISISFLEPIRDLAKNKNRLLGIFGTVILIFTGITFMRLPVFSSELNYWKSAAETSEHSAVVCRDYGVILTKLGDYKNAEKAFLEGIKRDPKETLIHYDLGVMYFKMQRYEDAKKQIAQELEINTTNFLVFHVMGVVYKQLKREEEASMMWEESVKINPNFQESYKELLSYYAQKKDTANFIRCKSALERSGMKIIKKQ